MRLLFINPHIADLVYTPLSYKIAGRKSLKKYQYLDKLFHNYLYYFPTRYASSLSKKILSKLPRFVSFVFIYFEINFWQLINERKINKLKKKDLENSNIFMFGYKFSNDFFDYLIENNFKNKIFVHISHYHTFSINEKYFSKLELKLCFDNDVEKNEFFKSKFPKYKKDLIIMPFEIKDKFFKNNNISTKKSRIVATGTYHIFKPGVTGINYLNYSTLHPIRLFIVLKKITCNHFVNYMSKYNPSNLFNLIKGQKKYMSLDIISEYLLSSHSFVGCEGTGAIAIGSLESMACGCIPFLSKEELKGLLFESKEAELEIYFSEDDLYKKIVNFNFQKKYNFSSKNAKLAQLYKSENLASLAKKNLDLE